MARRNTRASASSKKPAQAKKTSSQTVTRVERMDDSSRNEESMFEKISDVFQKNQSLFNIVLGGLIVVVLGVLLFNYFNKPTEDLVTPGQQTETTTDANGDVAKDKLPGKYTIKEGDTLFSIAKQYYDDGYKYPQLVAANNLDNENAITVGQTLTIPKLGQDDTLAQASASPSTESSATPTSEPTTMPQASSTAAPLVEGGTGGQENSTAWGDRITGDSYTVQEGDWLSKIAGRSYGDIYAYQKIVEANNIQDPNRIEVGTTLKIPR